MYKRVNELLGTKYESNEEIDWIRLTIDYNLSEEFIKEFEKKLSWNRISIYQSLSEDFIREFKDKLDWNRISANQILSWDFILEHEDLVDWGIISLVQPYIDSYYPKVIVDQMNYNKANKLYQKTKERGWFFGYMRKDHFFSKKRKQFLAFSYENIYVFDRESIFKVRIYWKDLISPGSSSKYEFIREVKYV